MKTISTIIICFVLCLGFTSHSHALFDNLKDKIQKELDVNPFLKKQQIKLKVTDETNGYVTIEMYEGNHKVKERIDEGIDILTGQIEQQWFWRDASAAEKETVKILRRTLGVIKSMNDVKEVLLTTDIRRGLLEDTEKADKFLEKSAYKQALELYQKAAEHGIARAQSGLGQMYLNGLGGLKKDHKTAYSYFQKAATQKSIRGVKSFIVTNLSR